MKKKTALLWGLTASVLLSLKIDSPLPSDAIESSHRSIEIATIGPGTLQSVPIMNSTPLPAVRQSTPHDKTKKPAKTSKKGRKRSKKTSLCAQANENEEKYVALTFDDGPSPVYTPKILEILKEEKVHATFFMIGREAKKYPDIVKQIVAEGHKVADHTMNHDEHLYKRSDEKMTTEIRGTRELLESIVPGVTVEYYRAPAGRINSHQRALVRDWGMKPIDWSVDTKDWQRPGVKVILKNVKRQLRNGGIILMHDSGGNRNQTVAALKKLIPKLKTARYNFVFPDSALAARRTPDLLNSAPKVATK